MENIEYDSLSERYGPVVQGLRGEVERRRYDAELQIT